MLESYGSTMTGCVRLTNQDRILTGHHPGLFAVADGMGGHRRGELAAELAIDAIQRYVAASQDRVDVTWPCGYNVDVSLDANRLNTAIQIANGQIRTRGLLDADCSGMGTTIAAILLGDGKVVVGNVGDSRVYLYRDTELTLVSHDDTLINAVAWQCADRGADLMKGAWTSVLTQAIGSHEEVGVHLVERPLVSGDLYLICSDGLHGVIGDSAIRSLLGTNEGLEHTALRLQGAAIAQGGPDNISVVLVSYCS